VSQTPTIESLLAEYAPMLARIANTHEANPSLQEDLLQDIGLAVWRALKSYRGEANIKTFIARIAHNRGVDHVIKETRHRSAVSADEGLEAFPSNDSQANSDMQIDFMSALYKLSLGHRQVITMQLEGFTHNEIAQVLGINEAAIAKRASRAKQQLEHILEEK